MENLKNLKEVSLLFVEDEDITRVQISRMLQKEFKEFIEAKDGEEGVELYKKYKPDIVLTDITMPNMNGLEMIKAIYEIDEDAVIIITTAHNETEFLIEAIELGVKSYVIKPINPILLINTLSKSIENILIKRELKKRDEILLQQSLLNAKADLLHDIAHHWRQPLAQISLFVESLLGDYEDGELNLKEFRDSVNKINKITTELSKTINIFTSNYHSTSKIFELKDSIDTILFVTKSLYEPKNIKINKSNLNNYYLNGDKNLFLQIINHLIINSIEAHNRNLTKEPFISIWLDKKSNCLIIEDNAGGIEEDKFNSILEPYFSTKDDLNGNGLGLFISSFLMKKEFNGEVNLKNGEFGLIVFLKFPNSVLYLK